MLAADLADDEDDLDDDEPSLPSTEVRGLHFEMTCWGAPEQYDVFDQDGLMVGYLRLRHGVFDVSYGGVQGRILFEQSFPISGFREPEEQSIGPCKYSSGRFESDEMRTAYLKIAARKILAHTADLAEQAAEQDRYEAIFGGEIISPATAPYEIEEF